MSLMSALVFVRDRNYFPRVPFRRLGASMTAMIVLRILDSRLMLDRKEGKSLSIHGANGFPLFPMTAITSLLPFTNVWNHELIGEK